MTMVTTMQREAAGDIRTGSDDGREEPAPRSTTGPTVSVCGGPLPSTRPSPRAGRVDHRADER